jgi:hypothetical protein
MIKHKWLISTRNKISSLWGEMDSCAAIEGAKMTEHERDYIKTRLKDVVNYIDDKIFKR